METTASTPIANSQPAAGRANARDENGDGTVLSSDFETFLKMLTVQMENQDPLNPMQSSDFAVQLATFSAVEQQVRTNELLEGFVSAQSLGGLGDLAGWVGKEARAPVSTRFDGTPIPVFAEIPASADQATLVVRDETGTAITRVAFSPSDTDIAWNGTDASGAAAPPGLYSFSIELAAEGTPLPPVPGEVYARVAEVRQEGGANVLVFEGGETILPDEASGLRSGPSSAQNAG